MVDSGRRLIDVVFVPSPVIVAEGYFILAQELKRMEEPVKDIASYISEQYANNFATGDSWAPLMDTTLERKERGGWPEDILVREGALAGEVSAESSWEINRESSGATGVFSGGPAISEYGHFHIEGTKWMVARDFLVLTPEQLDETENIFDEWVDSVITVF